MPAAGIGRSKAIGRDVFWQPPRSVSVGRKFSNGYRRCLHASFSCTVPHDKVIYCLDSFYDYRTEQMTGSPLPKSRAAIAVILAAVLVGCASPQPVEEPDNTPGVRTSILQAAERAEAKKAQMADAATPASLSGNTMTVIWEGDASEILKRIAAAQKLTFKHTGPQPHLALPVFIKLRNVTLAQALTAVGEQCGGRADVVLNDSSIELRSKLY
ncbi:DotD/TraH family lipoprotein [Massilia orientalis]|uniref:DotD/TraH family lipoprotein n=1 Tax=Massilia orientalis TaxID=3050128 RepID=A0ACC7MF79_9BURK|nr:DotD/TraH family lipoprotein [Massilia sp. YIM B02787]